MDLDGFGWIILLLVMLVMLSLIPARPSLQDIERFFIYENKNRESKVYKEPVIENFGFENDKPADPELIVSGLNDCNAIIGSGDGIRDLFDYSDRFITEQIEASNDIPIIEIPLSACK